MFELTATLHVLHQLVYCLWREHITFWGYREQHIRNFPIFIDIKRNGEHAFSCGFIVKCFESVLSKSTKCVLLYYIKSIQGTRVIRKCPSLEVKVLALLLCPFWFLVIRDVQIIAVSRIRFFLIHSFVCICEDNHRHLLLLLLCVCLLSKYTDRYAQHD